MIKIQKLPQELVNQIAAGEVIERPASVIKELVDNSIDAGAQKIKIRIKQGGLALIEVADDGVGIPKEMLNAAFELHATSKIGSIDDLNVLLSLGFRGEALSTIVSVAEVTAISKYEEAESAYQIAFDGIVPQEIIEAPRDQGTTVTVQNLFGTIPARKKYLKSPDTEYRKILEILIPYFILKPEIHFVLEKDGKVVYNLPVSGEKDQLSSARISDVLKSEFVNELISLFYDGDGIKISGFIAHPRFNTTRTSAQFIFVNGRAITDRGIYKAVHEGFARFIPHGQKIPFIIRLDINPTLVDINVHPRKEEVRFLNAYRVYSAVERAVSVALEKEMKKGEVERYVPPIDSELSTQQIAVNRLRGDSSSYTDYSESASEYSNAYMQPSFAERVDYVATPQSNAEPQSMFGEALADNSEDEYRAESQVGEIKNALQVFGKYIIVEFADELWMLDQHAAAERITFEKLLRTYAGESSDIQHLLVPYSIEMEEVEALAIQENVQFFKQLGFDITVKGNLVEINSVPVEFENIDLKLMFDQIFEELNSEANELNNNFERLKEDILATVACHSSIRTKQLLHKRECISILEQLLQCDNPYSCPHGRPIIWKQKLTEIDKNFYRTY